MTIAVLRKVAVRQEGVGVMSCPAPIAVGLSAHLRRPLGGRTILGRSPEVLANPRAVFGYTGGASATVPRLVGFSPLDAKRALTYGYLGGRVANSSRGSGRARVVAQRPAPGQTVPRGSSVELVVARS